MRPFAALAQRWHRTQAPADPVPSSAATSAAVRHRRYVRLIGVVSAVSVRPRSDGVPSLVVDLEGVTPADHTRDAETDQALAARSRVHLVWLGRRSIAGIAPGVTLKANGVPSQVRGTPTMYNPAYEIIVAPSKPDRLTP